MYLYNINCNICTIVCVCSKDQFNELISVVYDEARKIQMLAY